MKFWKVQTAGSCRVIVFVAAEDADAAALAARDCIATRYGKIAGEARVSAGSAVEIVDGSPVVVQGHVGMPGY